jgi:hypothetical protein
MMAVIFGNPRGAAVEPNADTRSALSVLIKAARSPGVSLTENELVRAMAESANTGKPAKQFAAGIEIHGQIYFDATDLERCVELKKDLAAFVRGVLSDKAIARLKKAACQMAMIPTPSGGYRFFPENLSAVFGHGLGLLQDEKRPLGRDFKQCVLPSCGRFFLPSDLVDDPSDPGRRRNRFCSDEHETRGQSPGSMRQRRYRERKAKQSAAAIKHK